jgi:hypothetical protein
VLEVLFALIDKPPAFATSNLYAGLVVPIPTFCDVSIVRAVVEPLVASCNTPEVSPAMLSAVPDVVPAEIIDAMYFPL